MVGRERYRFADDLTRRVARGHRRRRRSIFLDSTRLSRAQHRRLQLAEADGDRRNGTHGDSGRTGGALTMRRRKRIQMPATFILGRDRRPRREPANHEGLASLAFLVAQRRGLNDPFRNA